MKDIILIKVKFDLKDKKEQYTLSFKNTEILDVVRNIERHTGLSIDAYMIKISEDGSRFNIMETLFNNIVKGAKINDKDNKFIELSQEYLQSKLSDNAKQIVIDNGIGKLKSLLYKMLEEIKTQTY